MECNDDEIAVPRGKVMKMAGSESAAGSGVEMHRLMRELFPICRSITGHGMRESLDILGRRLPLKIYEIPSGTECFDWTVPNEWNIRDAYVADLAGNRVIDFQKNNLHVVGYSEPVDTTMTLEELRPYLHTRPDMPDVVPYVTSYYRRRWGFCLSQAQLETLTEGDYRVCIDSTLAPGSLTYGEIFIPGRSDREILLSTYLCHPSMANNELSGPVLTAFIAAELLKREQLQYSYRIVFCPETIGALCYLSRNLDEMKRNTVGGYVVTCVGGPDNFTYLESRNGDALIDRSTLHTLRSTGRPHRVVSFTERGSDERQYNAPGIDLNVGSLMRSKYGDYPEYHTSADDLSFVTAEQMEASFTAYMDCIATLEANTRPRSLTLGEPNLGERDLYPTLGAGVDNGGFVDNLLAVLAYADGKRDLIEIAELHGKSVTEYSEAVAALAANDLIEQGVAGS
jgi:aminopeptidase-like protein